MTNINKIFTLYKKNKMKLINNFFTTDTNKSKLKNNFE